MNTFRTKGKADFKHNLYESSLNPFSRNFVKKDEAKNITGDRKKMSEHQSFKKTDPILMKYESVPAQAHSR